MKQSNSKTGPPSSARTQRERIHRVLTDAHGGWVPSPQIAALAQQYGARVYELRRAGFVIENKTQTNEGTGERHSWFRLVLESPPPVPPPQPIAGQDWYPNRATGLPLFDGTGTQK